MEQALEQSGSTSVAFFFCPVSELPQPLLAGGPSSVKLSCNLDHKPIFVLGYFQAKANRCAGLSA